MNCWLRLTPVRVYFWNDLRHDIAATLYAPIGLPKGRLSLLTPDGLIKVTCYLLD